MRKGTQLLAGQAKTDETKQALNTLLTYTIWVNNQIQEIVSNKETFEQRIITLNPEVTERLRHL